MNIKYVTDVRIPTSRAAGYAVMKMCEQFSLNLEKVSLYIPNKTDSDSLGDPFTYYNIKEKFDIVRLKGTDFLGSTMSLGRLFYWIDFIFFLLVVKINVKLNKEDILYTRNYFIPLIFSKSNFICLELHDIPSSRILFKQAIKKVDVFVVLNNNLKNELMEMGVLKENILISPSGVDVAEFYVKENKEECREKLGLPKDKKIVLYTGHLYKWKGVDTLAQVAKKMTDVLFVFVGGVEPEISSFRKIYGNCENILILPFVERRIIAFYLGSADVLVLPNSNIEKISRDYTSPLKMFEYMFSGRPIVASNISSINEILDNSNSVFAEPDNPNSFLSAINLVLEDSNLSKEIAENAKSKSLSYTWDKRVKNILNFINQKT